ncbi:MULTISPECIES: cysteine-rich CWC family protein [Roseateles]|uniref:cysteine-rich CWC family protein n=1 Tax=Roseateles TaxID=93681 RepID=UPI0039647B60
MTALGKPLEDRCPRCGGSFHCAAAEGFCDCFELQLSAPLRQALAAQYSSCLCINCLKQLQSQTPTQLGAGPAQV